MLQGLTKFVVVALAAVLTATAAGLPATQAETAPVTALTLADPTPVTALRSWPATDGIGLAWEPAGLGSYAVDRRSGADGWLRIADRVDVSQYADTAAPAGLASAYRITPIGEAGEFPGGSSESAPVTPLAAWQPPTGAQTHGSVDGIGLVGAADMYLGPNFVEVYPKQYSRPGIRITRDSLGWRTGTFAVGRSAAYWGVWTSDDPTQVVTGTLVVSRVVLRADGTPAELAAVLTGTRVSGDVTVPVRAIIVWGTLATGLPAYIVGEPASISVPIPEGSDQSKPVALRNVGGTAGSVTTVQVVSRFVSPPQFPAWSTSSTCLNVQIAPAGRCTTSVRVQFETAANGIGYPEAAATWRGAGGLVTTVALSGDWQSVYEQPTLLMSAPALVRTAATVTLTADDPQAGEPLQMHCRLDAAAFSPCTSPWSLTALKNGRHTVTAYVTDQAGNMSQWHRATITADSVGPVTAMVTPKGVVTWANSVLVSWTSNDVGAGVKVVQARRRTATPTTTYSGYVVPSCCTASVSNGVWVTPTQGVEQCWSARAVDLFLQWGAWSSERCFLSPLDDRKLESNGFVRESSYTYKYWKSTARRTGATLRLNSVRARQVGLLVQTCSTCGSMDVYVGSTRLGRVSTYAATSRSWVVIWLPRQAVERRGTLMIRSTSSKRVVVDGVLIRHR